MNWRGSTTDREAGRELRAAEARLQAIRAAFPRRALKVRPPAPGLWSLMGQLFWGPILLPLVVLSMSSSWLPLLTTDVPLALSGKAVVMAEQYLGPASRCRFVAVVVTECDLELRARVSGGLWQSRNVSYAHFFGRPAALAELRVLGLPAEPHRLTVDAALERVVNRVLLLAFFVGAGLAAALWFARGIVEDLRIRRRMRRALSGQVLTPVLLRLSPRAPAEGGARSRRSTGFRLHALGSDLEIPWRNPRGEALFPMVRPAQGPPALVLGVAAPGGGVAMPLDAALTWLRLTEAERDALLAAAGLPERPAA
jgi:hypothetical protein